jgi:hypothetical protein
MQTSIMGLIENRSAPTELQGSNAGTLLSLPACEPGRRGATKGLRCGANHVAPVGYMESPKSGCGEPATSPVTLKVDQIRPLRAE